MNYFTTTVPIKHCIIIKKLLENIEFRNYFINRYADLFNSSFSNKYLIKMLDTLSNTIKPDIDKHFTKWGKQYGDWENEINNEIIPYINQRHNLSKNDVIKEFKLPAYHYIKINTFPENAFKQLNINSIDLTENNFEGYYFESVPITFAIKPMNGYVFSHWQQSNGKKFYTDSITINMNDSSQFTAIYFHENEKNKLVVFPNPAQKSNIYIKLNNDFKELKSISIINTLGQIIYSNKQPIFIGNNILEIETDQLQQGMYYINIEMENEQEVVKLIMLDK
jgi:hypothetical protein